MGKYLADLHNHSCLSPCGDLSMSPRLLARQAKARGVDILGLSDHNAAHNCLPFALACAREGLVPLFGLELCSTEEVHLLAVFSSPRKALEFGSRILANLPRFPGATSYTAATSHTGATSHTATTSYTGATNDSAAKSNPGDIRSPAAEGIFGDQAVVDDEEAVLCLEETWFGAALSLDFGALAELASASGALVIPAHVDRPMFSVQSQLGFLPPGPYDAVEAVRPPVPAFLSQGLGVVTGSDAHFPEHIGRRPFALELPDQPVRALKTRLAEFAADSAAAAATPTSTIGAAQATEVSAVRDAAQAPGVSVSSASPTSTADTEAEYRGYEGLLKDRRVGKYPEDEAEEFLGCVRRALAGITNGLRG